jgi:membrane protein
VKENFSFYLYIIFVIVLSFVENGKIKIELKNRKINKLDCRIKLSLILKLIIFISLFRKSNFNFPLIVFDRYLLLLIVLALILFFKYFIIANFIVVKFLKKDVTDMIKILKRIYYIDTDNLRSLLNNITRILINYLFYFILPLTIINNVNLFYLLALSNFISILIVVKYQLVYEIIVLQFLISTYTFIIMVSLLSHGMLPSLFLQISLSLLVKTIVLTKQE